MPPQLPSPLPQKKRRRQSLSMLTPNIKMMPAIATIPALFPVVPMASEAFTPSKLLETVLEDIKDTVEKSANPLPQQRKKKKMATKNTLATKRQPQSSQLINS
ncbi:hypothetical protein V6N13_110803 [Hibiscus sabdariffa]|uniref:Uncharacterized protein n=1 Tax=Hibiscus sabdariffa TaxID=183260 RepID=A0ABR2TI95_9ROSI